jgi:AraC-like DNA-binding protein
LMPEMNGFELCEKVKTDIKTSHIPVVLLTACTSIDDRIKGIKGGADAYVEKPFDINHLVSTIESLLIGRKQLRERYQMDLPLTLDQENNNGRDHIFLEKLYQLISENIDNQELDVDQFARKLYLNRTHFYQKVKILTGFTPYELLKAYRLKKAAELLVYEDVSVADVSTMTGFKSRTHFSKIFKEQYSTTPGKYANAMKKKILADAVPIAK